MEITAPQVVLYLPSSELICELLRQLLHWANISELHLVPTLEIPCPWCGQNRQCCTSISLEIGFCFAWESKQEKPFHSMAGSACLGQLAWSNSSALWQSAFISMTTDGFEKSLQCHSIALVGSHNGFSSPSSWIECSTWATSFCSWELIKHWYLQWRRSFALLEEIGETRFRRG